MNYIKITKTDIANGPGVRVVLWVAGCRCKCKGCHNASTWSFDAGQEFTDETIQEIIDAVNKPWITGLTLSGGHPLEPEHLPSISGLIVRFKKECPDKTLWLYTGYTLDYSNFCLVREITEQEHQHNVMCAILNSCDIVVDGPYIESQRNLMLLFRGSENQRLIDVKQTILNKQITEYDEAA